MAKASNGRQLFSTEFSGFNKKQVTTYIAGLENQYNVLLRQKDDQFDSLDCSYRELQDKYAELFDSYMALQDEKSKIADVLIGAENTAKEIVDKARTDAEKEKLQIEQQTEVLREKIVDRNRIIRDMSSSVNNMVAEFEEMVKKAVCEMNASLDKALDDFNNDAQRASASDSAYDENEDPNAKTDVVEDKQSEDQVIIYAQNSDESVMSDDYGMGEPSTYEEVEIDIDIDID